MGSAPTFPTTSYPTVAPPSTDNVHLRVEVDRSRCSTPEPSLNSRLVHLEAQGITISIAQLVANANLHFANSGMDDGAGEEEARMRAAWELLRHWNMEAVPHYRQPNRMVLRVAEQPNSRMTAIRSEVLAIGVALEVGIRLYEMPYAYWAATEGLQAFDLQCSDDDGNEFRIEARGRIDRTNVRTAIEQVHTKFPNADFSHAAGVIFFPRTTNRGRKDLIVLDPEGKPQAGLANRKYRNLLLHYAPIFIAQGGLVRRFGQRLRTLAKASDIEFQAYLATGDNELQGVPTRRARTSLAWRGTLYLGTFFEDFVWPDWLTSISPPNRGGVFFWGVAKEIVVAIENGALATLRFPVGEQAIVDRTEATMAIIMPDRTALIWSGTTQDLDRAERDAVEQQGRMPA